MKRGKALSDHGRGKQPSGVGQGAGAVDPGRREQRLAQARSLWSSGKWQAAQDAFSAIPSLEDDPRAMVMQASCLRELGRHEDAAALLEKTALRADRMPLHAIERIKLALETGKSADALAIAEEAVAGFPNHADLRMLLGRALAATNAVGPAVAAYEAALRLGAGAIARSELTRLTESGSAGERPAQPAGQPGPAPSGPHDALLRLREMREDRNPERRVAEAEQAVRAYPDNKPLAIHWALELREAGSYDRAQEVLRPLAEDDDVAACIGYARVIEARGNPGEALGYMEGVIDRHPEHAHAFLVWFFLALKEVGRDAATTRAERRIRMLGTSRIAPRVLAEICNQLIRVGRHDRVLSLIEGVQGDDREVALLHVAASRAALGAGQPEKAREHFAEAVLRLCDTAAARRFEPLLEEALFCSRISPLLEISRRLNPSETARGVDPVALSAAGDDAGSYLRDLVDNGDFVASTAREFMDMVFACHDAGLYDLIRDFVSKFDDFGFLDVQQVEQVVHLLSIADNPDPIPKLVEEIVRRTRDGDQANLYWRLYRVMHSGCADASIAEAEQAIGRHEAGRPLTYFLALSIDRIIAVAADGPYRAAALSIAERLPTLIRSHSVLSFVERERRVTTLMRQALPRPRPCLATLLIPLHRRDDIGNVRRNLVRQTWDQLEAIVLPNGPEVTRDEVQAALGDLPFVRIHPVPAARIGRILNQGVAQARGEYVLRFDADDIYLDHYVTNMVSSLQHSDADLIYKNSTFVFIESLDQVVLIDRGPDLMPVAGGNGASQGYKTDTLKRHGFDETLLRSEDIQLARRIAGDGGRVLSVDPFDFVVVRRSNKSTHTWHAPDYHLYGDPMPLGPLDVIDTLSIPVHE